MDDFATRLRSAMAKRGLSQSDLARRAGIDRTLISKYLGGKFKASQQNLYALSDALDVSEAWLMGHDAPMERKMAFGEIRNVTEMPKTKKVPILGKIACGDPILAVENAEERADMPVEIRADFALRCVGDSMKGSRIYDGDIVYIRNQPDVENGEIAAVLVGDEATLKRVYKSDGQITLMPDNNAYAPQTYVGAGLKNVRILGKAVAFTGTIR